MGFCLIERSNLFQSFEAKFMEVQWPQFILDALLRILFLHIVLGKKKLTRPLICLYIYIFLYFSLQEFHKDEQFHSRASGFGLHL